ncbi:zinc finger and BTB domain-containing protein 7B [Corythoichthys intestinalis]|uniref:zinc finger and BTB domain-containing protein 7B n=1 Tax=Corythoichthys intestinalis TaxID=161448 RepID=UPI0025A51E15|nr:zinc finger and BTB domain-containing protein 7B [Corythoichthys intestinalis]XP_061789009.1 zinc finger and BTB domain-containing protein 7B-like [Nerophis lumbriciformis]
MSSGEDGLIGIPFPEHSNELLSHLNDQRRSGLLCDLTLTSRGARYPTHRAVMAAVSLYFRRLFGAEEGGCGEGGGGFSVCQLDCVAPDALDALLEFAYTATLTIPCSGMRDVLRGAQLLGIQCVADACRDILGEKAEQDDEKEPGDQRAAAVQRSEGENESRRKMDRKKLKKVGPHHINSLLNPPPASPVSYPSPLSESLRLRTPAQPPSPESEEPFFRGWQNGNPGAVRVPERSPTLTGGHLHWMPQRPPPPAVPPEDKLSEEEDMEAFGNEGTLMESTSTTSPATERAEGAGAASATITTGVGRRRKSQMPQQCPVCQKIIHGAGKLPRHMRTHTGEKPFQCTACGVRFTRNDKLKIHMRKHTGERPYSCPHCTARFLHSYDLKNHLSLHSGARPFECQLCHKAFAREDHLQRHRKGHSCLELRMRRPRAETDEQEEADINGGERIDSLEPPRAHSSSLLRPTMLEGGMFQADIDRERSLALQALAQLSPQQFANYHALYLRGMEMRGSGEGETKDSGGVNMQRHSWPPVAGEKIGEVEEE